MLKKECEFIVKTNFERFLKCGIITNDSLERYFNGCFSDIGKLIPLYKIWICVNCLMKQPSNLKLEENFGYGKTTSKCKTCSEPVYEVGTFQARSSQVGYTFEHACYYLLKHGFGIDSTISGGTTRLYDLEVKPNIVIEAKGSPKFIINPDGRQIRLPRPGMLRTDTEKKAFRNAEKWHNNFPNGVFFILTNTVPKHLIGHRDSKVRAVVDVTNKEQMVKLVNEIKAV